MVKVYSHRRTNMQTSESFLVFLNTHTQKKTVATYILERGVGNIWPAGYI